MRLSMFAPVLLGAMIPLTGLTGQLPDLPRAPGNLVDVGAGRRLHLLCSGRGSPTVVLEAGASSFAIDWTLVRQTVDRSTRVCAYDRAGMGWSDSAAVPGSEANDLHRLLRASGERPPYVLVGASRGGLLIRRYLADYPSDVAGLVFVDPATEDRLWIMLGGRALLFAALTPSQLDSTLPRAPVAVPRRPVQTGAPFDKLPPELYDARMRLDARLVASLPDTMTPEMIATAQRREQAFLAQLLASRAATPHPFGDRPTVVLSRGDERNAGREEVHAALARLSTNSRHAVVPGAGHEIHLFEPDAVVRAILDVLRVIRENGRL